MCLGGGVNDNGTVCSMPSLVLLFRPTAIQYLIVCFY